MKLAEALMQRADIQTRIQELRDRLVKSAVVQEGEQPPEDPQELLRELDTLTEQLEELIRNINRTNLQAQLENGTTLTDALAKRDVIATKRGALQHLVNAASVSVNRYSKSEIKLLPTVDIREIRKQLDRLARDYRELDAEIQRVNWETELIEA